MLIDSHCHLDCIDLNKYNNDFSQLLQAARNNDVGHFLCVSIELEPYQNLVNLAEQYENISISVGIHPNSEASPEPSVERLVALAQHPKCIAIGETGLDYYRSQGDLTWQQDRFRNHIRAAKQSKKPLIIHTRDAAADTLDIMQQERASDIAGVMHCFTETWDVAKKALDMGFYISFSGILTFKNATQIQDVAKKVPLDRILIETDSPYLAPMPHRGTQNEPAYVKYVAMALAELRQLSYEEIAKTTTDNFSQLFNIAM